MERSETASLLYAGAGERPLTRGERIVLVAGLYAACALIALVDRPSARHHRVGVVRDYRLP
jgi:transcription initiation factor TFIIIB Brf1 subunit/transcription initiation factor TFIIB